MKFSSTIFVVAFAMKCPSLSAQPTAQPLSDFDADSGYEDCEVCRDDPSNCGKVDEAHASFVCPEPFLHTCSIEGLGCYASPVRPLSHCLEHDGLQRCWMTHVPEKVSSPPKLVVDIHGYISTAVEQSAFSGFKEKSEEEGFIVVWPQGYQYLHEGVDVFPAWNMGAVSAPDDVQLNQRGCCEAALEMNTDDVGFLRRMVHDVSSTYGVDPYRHVYFTGISNGCGMAQRMAAEANDIVAAVACNCMYLLKAPEDFPKDQYERNGPVPVLEIHGTVDDLVPYDGFLSTDIGAKSNREAWASYNGCGDASTPSECYIPKMGSDVDYNVLSSTEGCAGGAEAALMTLDGIGHFIAPPLKGVPDVASLSWDFMKRYPEEEGGGDDVGWHGECGMKPTSMNAGDVVAAALVWVWRGCSKLVRLRKVFSYLLTSVWV